MADSCNFCSSTLAPDAKFCTSCGSSTGADHRATQTDRPVTPETDSGADHPRAHPAVLAVLVALPVLALALGFIPNRWMDGWNGAPAAALFPVTAGICGAYAARIQPKGRWLLPLLLAGSLIIAGLIISAIADAPFDSTKNVAPLIVVPLLLGFALSWSLRRVSNRWGVLLAGVGLSVGVASDLVGPFSTTQDVFSGDFSSAIVSIGRRAVETLSIAGLFQGSLVLVVTGILGAAGMTLFCVGLAMLLPRRGVASAPIQGPDTATSSVPAGAPTLVALEVPLPEGTPGVVVGPDGRQYVMASSPATTPAASDRTNPLAGMALAFGILGGLVAIPLGHIALHQIKRTGERGRGMALTGLVFAYLWVAALVGFIVWFASLANSTSSYY